MVLLALLSREPNTGYGLGRLLRLELSHIWSARPQHFYSELSQLVQEGLAEVQTVDLKNRPAKKIYSLTPAGLASLDAWLQRRSVVEAPKDGLLARLYCLERAPGELIGQLEERQRERESEAVVLGERIAQIRGDDLANLADKLTLEAALSQAEAQAAWCEASIAAILTQTERRG